ncbi:LamG-like jellyroll fold domain-containing protein [Alkalibacterium sp. f15]|uniref:LamG-like jellyroll fold domain-containing protein n=1 Tax=Alkalibacterium sp. f15 TaxID=3414029 RepID=UPI003BF8E94F
MLKNRYRNLLFIIVLSLLVIIPIAKVTARSLDNNSTYQSSKNLEYDVESPAFTEASVHDPSVIRVDESFYVFGSHLASAKTTDLMNWEQVSTTVNPNNPLIENVFEELSEAFEWANTETLWAADVRQLGDGRFYMYYNASQGDAPRSAMGLAIADDVEGPYKNQGIFLKSGMWDQESPDGSIYDATVHPNAVDPHTFYDKDEDLWMVYGSYSGGIFILEMNEETGLPLEGQGYATHLIGGNHSRIEGAFIEYNTETDYYYMYMTFGGLDADGGYNMRVARSENPAGPYLDAEGNIMSDVKGAEVSFFDDRSIEPYAVKQMGNYLFKRELGEKGTGIGTGYVSAGHNSVYTNEDDEIFIFFHTRFPQTGEMHEIRVHQMFMNESGWPVIAPYRFTGETLDKINRQDVIGEYKYIDHEKDISSEINVSETITLEKNNKLSGSVSGSWKSISHNTVELTIDGDTYNGVFLRQWNPTSNEVVMTFTALSEKGVAVWGSQLEVVSNEEVVQAIVEELDIDETIITSIELPTTGMRNATITWISSDETVVTNDGEVTRPENGAGDAIVTLTAEIVKGEVSQTKEFIVTVPELNEGGLVAHYSFEGSLENKVENDFGDGILVGNRIDTEGGTLLFGEGQKEDSQSLHLDGQSGIRLPDGLITNHTYSVSLWLNPNELTPFTTTFFGLRTVNDWVSLVPNGPASNQTMVWSGSQSWYDAATGLTIPENEWSHVAFTVEEGEIIVYVNGEEMFRGEKFPHIFSNTSSVFSLGVNYWDTPFNGLVDEVSVYDNLALPSNEITDLYNDLK